MALGHFAAQTVHQGPEQVAADLKMWAKTKNMCLLLGSVYFGYYLQLL